jgi:nitrite reductase/ring-hydroxylating ferredoxin subunit
MALRVRLCPVADVVEGALRGYRVRGVTWPVMITQQDGVMTAFPGVCPHDDVSLVDYGMIEEGELVCRVHGYRFELATGRCEHAPKLQLRRYKITVIDAVVWVDLL